MNDEDIVIDSLGVNKEGSTFSGRISRLIEEFKI